MPRIPHRQSDFADLAFRQQGVELDPILQIISDFLDSHDDLIEQVRRDLERGLKNPHTGRDGLTPAQVLRSFILRRIKNWEYRELRERIADGYTLRQFTDFYSQSVPKHDAFHRAFNRLTPHTLQTINELIIRAAVEMGLEDGSRLRVDTSVVDSNIHHPTDSRLLWDSVRVLTRLGDRLVKKVGPPAFPHHTRAARRRMQAIERMSAQQRQEQQVPKYRELLRITEEVVQNARQLLQRTENAYGLNFKEDVAIRGLRQEIEHFCQLADKVLNQTRRRVLEGETVPASQKIYSIFEPHTDMIKRGKVNKPVEFGHKVFLAESEQGLITDYEILAGNPNDQEHVAPSLERHQKLFGHAPEWYSRKPARCQRTTVSGLTSTRDCFQAPQKRRANTQKILSTPPIRGLGCLRFSPASCCRRARFSKSRLRCDCQQRVSRPNHNPTWRNMRDSHSRYCR